MAAASRGQKKFWHSDKSWCGWSRLSTNDEAKTPATFNKYFCSVFGEKQDDMLELYKSDETIY